MSTRWMAIYGGFFLGALLTSLYGTGLLQEGILPRLTGAGAAGAKAAPAAAESKQTPSSPSAPEPMPSTSNDGEALPQASGRSDKAVAAATKPSESGASRKRLGRVYEGMRPKEAAAVLEKLERPLAADVLREIREKQASKILAAMPPAAAADLTRLLGGGLDGGQP